MNEIRPYSLEELTDLTSLVGEVFQGYPVIVMVAVLMVMLKEALGDDSPSPELKHELDRCLPVFVKVAVDGPGAHMRH